MAATQSGAKELFRKRDVLRQLRSFGRRRLLFRIVERIESGSRNMRDSVIEGSLRELDLDGLAAHAYHKDLRVAPGDPSGLVALTGVGRDGVKELEAAGLEPCCAVRGPIAERIDVWVQLAPSEAAVADVRSPDGSAVSPRLLLTVAAQRMTAIAGGDPRVAHYAQGGYVAGVWQAWSQGEAAILVAEDRLATARSAFLQGCATRALEIAAAADIAAAAGVDPERENEALAATGDLGVSLATLYRRHAAVARYWGVTDAALLDRSVAAAAARLGAPAARVRALLAAGSGLAGASGFANHVTAVVASVFADPTTIYAASRLRTRADRAAHAGEVWADMRGVGAAVAAESRRMVADGDGQ